MPDICTATREKDVMSDFFSLNLEDLSFRAMSYEIFNGDLVREKVCLCVCLFVCIYMGVKNR
jgi:hypothetical protein